MATYQMFPAATTTRGGNIISPRGAGGRGGSFNNAKFNHDQQYSINSVVNSLPNEPNSVRGGVSDFRSGYEGQSSAYAQKRASRQFSRPRDSDENYYDPYHSSGPPTTARNVVMGDYSSQARCPKPTRPPTTTSAPVGHQDDINELVEDCRRRFDNYKLLTGILPLRHFAFTFALWLPTAIAVILLLCSPLPTKLILRLILNSEYRILGPLRWFLRFIGVRSPQVALGAGILPILWSYFRRLAIGLWCIFLFCGVLLVRICFISPFSPKGPGWLRRRKAAAAASKSLVPSLFSLFPQFTGFSMSVFVIFSSSAAGILSTSITGHIPRAMEVAHAICLGFVPVQQFFFLRHNIIKWVPDLVIAQIALREKRRQLLLEAALLEISVMCAVAAIMAACRLAYFELFLTLVGTLIYLPNSLVMPFLVPAPIDSGIWILFLRIFAMVFSGVAFHYCLGLHRDEIQNLAHVALIQGPEEMIQMLQLTASAPAQLIAYSEMCQIPSRSPPFVPDVLLPPQQSGEYSTEINTTSSESRRLPASQKRESQSWQQQQLTSQRRPSDRTDGQQCNPLTLLSSSEGRGSTSQNSQCYSTHQQQQQQHRLDTSSSPTDVDRSHLQSSAPDVTLGRRRNPESCTSHRVVKTPVAVVPTSYDQPVLMNQDGPDFIPGGGARAGPNELSTAAEIPRLGAGGGGKAVSSSESIFYPEREVGSRESRCLGPRRHVVTERSSFKSTSFALREPTTTADALLMPSGFTRLFHLLRGLIQFVKGGCGAPRLILRVAGRLSKKALPRSCWAFLKTTLGNTEEGVASVLFWETCPLLACGALGTFYVTPSYEPSNCDMGQIGFQPMRHPPVAVVGGVEVSLNPRLAYIVLGACGGLNAEPAIWRIYIAECHRILELFHMGGALYIRLCALCTSAFTAQSRSISQTQNTDQSMRVVELPLSTLSALWDFAKALANRHSSNTSLSPPDSLLWQSCGVFSAVVALSGTAPSGSSMEGGGTMAIRFADDRESVLLTVEQLSKLREELLQLMHLTVVLTNLILNGLGKWHRAFTVLGRQKQFSYTTQPLMPALMSTWRLLQRLPTEMLDSIGDSGLGGLPWNTCDALIEEISQKR